MSATTAGRTADAARVSPATPVPAPSSRTTAVRASAAASPTSRRQTRAATYAPRSIPASQMVNPAAGTGSASSSLEGGCALVDASRDPPRARGADLYFLDARERGARRGRLRDPQRRRVVGRAGNAELVVVHEFFAVRERRATPAVVTHGARGVRAPPVAPSLKYSVRVDEARRRRRPNEFRPTPATGQCTARVVVAHVSSPSSPSIGTSSARGSDSRAPTATLAVVCA